MSPVTIPEKDEEGKVRHRQYKSDNLTDIENRHRIVETYWRKAIKLLRTVKEQREDEK